MAYSEKDEDTLQLYMKRLKILEDLIKSTGNILGVMLSNPDDALNAIVTIHPGAGGTESQDWANIVQNAFKMKEMILKEILRLSSWRLRGGIKDVSFVIR